MWLLIHAGIKVNPSYYNGHRRFYADGQISSLPRLARNGNIPMSEYCSKKEVYSYFPQKNIFQTTSCPNFYQLNSHEVANWTTSGVGDKNDINTAIFPFHRWYIDAKIFCAADIFCIYRMVLVSYAIRQILMLLRSPNMTQGAGASSW